MSVQGRLEGGYAGMTFEGQTNDRRMIPTYKMLRNIVF